MMMIIINLLRNLRFRSVGYAPAYIPSSIQRKRNGGATTCACIELTVKFNWCVDLIGYHDCEYHCNE